MKIYIHGARVMDPFTGEDGQRDVFIAKGMISEPFDDADRVIDANGLILTSGFIDVHTHLRDPGFEYKEDIVSGTKAAAAGGFTTVFSMPNTNPVCDHPDVVQYQIEKSVREGFCEVLPVAAATMGEDGKVISPFAELRKAGAVAVSDDGRVIANSAILRDIMLRASESGLIVIDHCEDPFLSAGACMNEGDVSRRLGVKGMPAAAESIMVARDLLIAETLQLPIHLCHISARQSVDLIRLAKSRGVRVSSDTCPHYFSLTEEAVEQWQGNARMYPPLRTEEDREAIVGALLDGTIEMISTDHAPHSPSEKESSLAEAKNGIIGLETAFTLAHTVLCAENHMPLMRLFEALSSRPAEIFGLGERSLTAGSPANLCLLDTEGDYRYDRELMLSRSRNTPFHGWTGQGGVVMTIWKGNITYER